jgi:hypothetical protein
MIESNDLKSFKIKTIFIRSGRWGRRFESSHPDQKIKLLRFSPGTIDTTFIVPGLFLAINFFFPPPPDPDFSVYLPG